MQGFSFARYAHTDKINARIEFIPYEDVHLIVGIICGGVTDLRICCFCERWYHRYCGGITIVRVGVDICFEYF